LNIQQAQLFHPSLYIARERANLEPYTCDSDSDDTKIITEAVAKAMVALPPPPPPQPPQVQQQNWIPRAFGFGGTGFFQNAAAMKQSMERYLEGYELTGF
jgi:hypothetical protein